MNLLMTTKKKLCQNNELTFLDGNFGVPLYINFDPFDPYPFH